MSKPICIARGRIVDPALGLDAVGELYLNGGCVSAIRAQGVSAGALPTEAAGGFTTVCMMPNTRPVTDTVEAVAALRARAAGINALPIGAVTMGQQGKTLVDAAALKAAGACALSEDGRSVADASVMLQAMRAAVEAGLPIFDHTEDDALPGTAAGEACMGRAGSHPCAGKRGRAAPLPHQRKAEPRLHPRREGGGLCRHGGDCAALFYL